MTVRKKLHIPNTLTEWDDQMLVPLNNNFGEIQRAVAQAQFDIESIASSVTQYVSDTNEALISINQILNQILEYLELE